MLGNLDDVLAVSSNYLLGRTDSPRGLAYQLSVYPKAVELGQDLRSVGQQMEELFNLDHKMDLFEFDEWQKPTPFHIKLINENFKMIVKLAEEDLKKGNENQ